MKRVTPPPARGDDLASPTGNVLAFPDVGAHVARPELSVSDKLDALFCRLTTRQRNLILAAAESDKPTPHSIIRQIAELENAIAAVATLWGEAEGAPR